MERRGLLVLVLVVFSVVLVSGCTDFLRRGADLATGGECMELEEEIEDHPGMDCRCYPTDFVPEGIRNRTGIEGEVTGKCFCTCRHEAVDDDVNISIVEGPDGQDIVTRLG